MAYEEFGLTEGDFYSRNFQKGMREDTMILNLGPQHPATHGVLRVIVELDGEYVIRAEPVIGYLHRMHEKMAEGRTITQYLPNMGRVDYGHALGWNGALVGAVERLAGFEVPERAEYIRVITTELNRITSHLLWWGAFTLDLGAITPIMYAFDDREQMLDILQMATGSRLTHSSFRFGGVCTDLSDRFIETCKAFVPHMRDRLPMYRGLVTDNVILRKRLEGVGIFDADLCRRYGASGPVVRGSGIDYDVRRAEPYSVYDRFDWKVPVYPAGDSMARYLVRMDEMEQSLNIIEQALASLPAGKIMMPKAPKVTWALPKGESYFATEGARGKVGVHLVSDGGKFPYKIKLRSPCYCNLSAFAEAARGLLLADALAILGSLDLVIPEIDR
ncbi:MAG TPA: NADPH-quinone oxidoreductase [Telmatospirillum sp.]|nr:NADPH-quinone oxidoreductase [Telmatospirillum sp.]